MAGTCEEYSFSFTSCEPLKIIFERVQQYHVYTFLIRIFRQGRSQTFQNGRAARGGGSGVSRGADWDSKWRLSIDLCTKCNFIGGASGGQSFCQGGGCPLLLATPLYFEEPSLHPQRKEVGPLLELDAGGVLGLGVLSVNIS